MTGVEVVGVISGATTLLGVCAEFGVQLNRFVQRAKEADTFAIDLQLKLNQLRECVVAVKQAARSRQRQVGPGKQNPEELTVWKIICRILCRCQEKFNRYEKMLKGITLKKEPLGLLEKALLQRKIDAREPRLTQLEKTINRSLTDLNTSFLSVHLIILMSQHDQISSNFTNNGPSEVINRLDKSLKEGSTKVKTNSHIDTEELDLNDSHVYNLSDPDTAVDPGFIIVDSVPMQPPVDGLIEDPSPYFDDTTPREVLDQLIARLRDQVERDNALDHFHQAAEHLRDMILLLKELHIGYGEPFTDFPNLQNQLATIYRKQGKKDEAEKVANAGLHRISELGEASAVKASTMVDAGVIPDNAKLYLTLGQIHREKYQSNKKSIYLDAAERDAKRGFKCSFESREDESFVETVILLIQIYEERGKMVHADTYRDLFLPSNSSSPCPSDTDESVSSSLEPLDLIDMIIQGSFDSTVDLPTGIDLELCRDGKTAMMYAVEGDDVYAIQKLHHAGAQLDRALFHAVQQGNADMTQHLLNLDAPKETKDCQSDTPLLAAAKSGYLDVMQRLLDSGADADAKDNEGWSVIHEAAHKGSLEMMQMLFTRDDRVNKDAVCSAGKTALHHLAERGNVEMAKLLLQYDVNKEIKDLADRTPLYLAVYCHKYDFVVLLLENHVTVDRAALPVLSQEYENLFRRFELGEPLE